MTRKLTTQAAAAGAGILAAAAGVGAAALAAAALGGESPAVALGSRVVDLTPGSVKDWAVRTLGTHDKPVLLGSVFLVMALLAAVAGLLTLRSRRLGLGLAAVLNLVALGAAVKTPLGLDVGAPTVAPGVVSLLVSLGGLAWFCRAWHLEAEAEKPAGFDRRTFLQAALATGAVAVVGGATSTRIGLSGAASRARISLPAPASPAAPVPSGAVLPVRGLTPYVTRNSTFYRVDTALQVPQVDAQTWKLRIHGMVDREVVLSYADLLRMPLVERRITLTCVSNEVGGTYVGNATWLGVRMKDLLERAGVRSGADAVLSTSVDDMTIGTPLDALTDGRDALLAVGMNGVPLPLEHGFPARMVTPGLYGFVSATKWVTDLEVTRFADFRAYWTKKGWAVKAPIHTESRIDVPRQFANVSVGKVAVAGVAWAQHTGVEKVEVRVDGGAWQQARLATQDTTDTWRQWVFPWEATRGQHKLEVRATDTSGYTQTPHRASPRPDGATGWHSVTVNVA